MGDRHPALRQRANDANFLVATAAGRALGGDPAEAVALFGPPYRQYLYHGDTIMVWRKNLLSQLPGPPRSGLDRSRLRR